MNAAIEFSGLKCGYLNGDPLIENELADSYPDSSESSSDENNRHFGVVRRVRTRQRDLHVKTLVVFPQNSTENCQKGVERCIATAILESGRLKVIQRSCWDNVVKCEEEKCNIVFRTVSG